MAYTGNESGARRRKLAGYLSQANELRRSYFQGGDSNWTHEQSEEEHNGTFGDAAVIRSGNEEMILFPSYAKRHVRAAVPTKSVDEAGNDADYWQRQWDKHDSDKGVIEVEVRGWIYNPQRGPHTRRQRLIIGLARQLSGIAAPSSADVSREASRASSPTRTSTQEEDLITLEAEHILRQGEKKAEYAGRGAFSEKPGQVGHDVGNFGPQHKAKSSDSLQNMPKTSRQTSFSSESSGIHTPIQKRDSWAQPAKMSAAELAMANKHLLARLRPFMSTPLVESPVKAFFYNDSTSRQRTVTTNASGHFHIRTVLDFVPTHVRLLAGDRLSATEEVIVTTPEGVSMISDIDDTIKHTAIMAGAREIFRNAFIRDLGELTITGVREWYSRLADMGVKMHYVSNSPWQMYPILTGFFKEAGLPRGSFHLKQYSGMLQGIFEPVAERKKSSLDRIMTDFPNRKFILVGDSGEADLEVYTDVVIDNPGRILGVFIRDVTTAPPQSGYFDPSSNPGRRPPRRQNNGGADEGLEMSKRLSRPADIRDDDADLRAALAASLADMEAEARQAKRSTLSDRFSDETERRPPLPPRVATSPLARSPVVPADDGDLIDLTDDTQMPWASVPPTSAPDNKTAMRDANGRKGPARSAMSPPPPPKPQALRSVSGLSRKAVPPLPRKPSTSIKSGKEQDKLKADQRMLPSEQQKQASPLSQMQRQDSVSKIPPPLPARRGYRDMAKDTLTSVIAATPTWQDGFPSRQRPAASRSTTSSRIDAPRPLTAISPVLSGQRHPDPSSIPDKPLGLHQRVSSSTSLSTSRKMINRMSTASSDDGFSSSPSEAGLSRRELVWVQRWQRAKGVMDRHGVTLRTWRVGSDVEEITVKLVEAAQRDFDHMDSASRSYPAER